MRFIALALALFAAIGCATAPAPCEPAGLAYAGTEGNRIHALRFDACAGKLALGAEAAQVPKPRWIAAHPAFPMVYVATDGDGKEGSVVTFALDRRDGALARVNEVGAGGGGTTHLWLDVPSMTLLASNFGSGSASSIAIARDGSLGKRVSTIQATGSGPHRRQAGPHAHGAAVDPSGRYALVADMGADRLFVYGFDRASQALSAGDAAARAFAVPPGSGPRHFVFHPTGRFVYLLNELTADVVVLRWDAQQGRLAQLQSLSTSSPEFMDARSGAEIAMSRDGRFVYVANRGESMLVVYRVDRDSGMLTLVQRVASGGQTPWTFDLHPSGRWLLVGNARSNSVKLFRVDVESGKVSDTGQGIDLPAAPWTVAFVS